MSWALSLSSSIDMVVSGTSIVNERLMLVLDAEGIGGGMGRPASVVGGESYLVRLSESSGKFSSLKTRTEMDVVMEGAGEETPDHVGARDAR